MPDRSSTHHTPENVMGLTTGATDTLAATHSGFGYMPQMSHSQCHRKFPGFARQRGTIETETEL